MYELYVCMYQLYVCIYHLYACRTCMCPSSSTSQGAPKTSPESSQAHSARLPRRPQGPPRISKHTRGPLRPPPRIHHDLPDTSCRSWGYLASLDKTPLHTRTHIHVHIFMHRCIYIYMRLYIHMHIYIYMDTYIYIDT